MEIRKTDRRQNSIPVEQDLRSGVDRRERAEAGGLGGVRDQNAVYCERAREHAKEQEHSSVFYALESVPTFRRLASLPEKIDSGENATALGMAGLALINLPEDIRDVGGALNQIKGIKPNYDYKNYQHGFSFFKGTMIEKWLHKHVDKDSKWANWLYENDKCLMETKFGEKALALLGGKEDDVVKTEIKNYKGRSVLAYSYKGSFLGEITGRALRRTTLLGVTAVGLLELPKIFNSDKKIKQTAKSALNITSITAGISYGGAIGAKYGGSVGSLVGMGLGAILGSKLSDEIQDSIT